MSFVNQTIKLSILILIISIFYKYYRLYRDEDLMKRIRDWGNTHQIQVNTSDIELKEFHVEYNENEWKALVSKIDSTRLFSTLNEKHVSRNEFGFDPDYARELAEYWKTKFNWKQQVDRLNKYKQYKMRINDTVIHFVRERVMNGADKETVNLVLIDGWPGSFYGFYGLLDYWKQNANKKYNYDIIVPSIPGFGFSTPLDRPIDTFDTALLFDAVMRQLHGFNVRYFVHGEDWGAEIATNLAQLYTPRVLGIHQSMVFGSEPFDPYYLFYSVVSLVAPRLIYTPEELESNITVKGSFASRFRMILQEAGYLHLQATKPDTIGHALSDSPVGLMAYILEKYSGWSFDFNSEIKGTKDASLGKFNRDDLLTIVTCYWMTNSITSSMRLYKVQFSRIGESFPKGSLASAKVSREVPLGFQTFRNELAFESSFFIKFKYENLKQFKIEKDGGHFAAFQKPKLTADDLNAFITSVLESN